MMQTNHNSLVKQLHKTQKNGHPRNYELDSMNPHRSYSVCAWSLGKTADQGRKPIICAPTVKPEVRGCHAAREPPSPSPHNTHALTIRYSKERIRVVYISIFFAIHVKFTANLFFHGIPNLDCYKKLTSAESRY